MSTTDVSPASSVSLTPPALPWWRYPLVWLVISGPAVVVVAGIITAWIAVRSQDPVVDENYYQKGLNINKTLAEQERLRALSPALKGRNHAATPTDALPDPTR